MTRGRPALRPVVYLAAGLITGLATYSLVAPFTCQPSGACEGWVAFQYQPDSAGHFQAATAALLLGASLCALLWLALSSATRTFAVARLIATPLFIAGAVVSIYSQSALLVMGPTLSVVMLWLMWTKPRGE
jgi:hypothetical protein